MNRTRLLALASLLATLKSRAQERLLYDAGAYQLYRDSVVQKPYTARVLSDKEFTTSYRSPANEYKSADISFKFSINGKDNEMKPGVNHELSVTATNGQAQTPLIRFGERFVQQQAHQYLKPGTQLTVRLDMRAVLDAFDKQGYYTSFNGDKIYKADFKGVYVAGNTTPMIWDFDNLVNHPQLRLTDKDGDGIYEVTLPLGLAEDDRQTASGWRQTRDLSAFPAYSSPYPLSNALYNLSIEEMINAVEPDSTFRTGKEWAGVWTRDISYSIILSMAHLQPDVARKSLLRKVNGKKKIIQDTGTGGAWPASTDRMIWAVAAWELYKATGDRDWLQEAYTIVRNSMETDLHVAFDPATGLMKGESSFLDWREQTYPKWMQPVDIAESECLGTNAVHFEAATVLARMASALGHGEEARKYGGIAKSIKDGINKYLWQPDRQYYGQYLYGRNNKLLSPRSEALGEALCVLFDIVPADRRAALIARVPQTAYGISCIYPQIPDIPPYHNNAVWPFVQTYWLWAAAKAGNEKAVMESIAAIYRPAALFATNKENFVADNGDFAGTQINSSNMLWSLSGAISIVHKVLFGIRFNEDGLSFEPFVPSAFAGPRELSHFGYRSATLDIQMSGFGNKIRTFRLDGKLQASTRLPANLTGHHTVQIMLANNTPGGSINKIANHTTLPAPDAKVEGNMLSWARIAGASTYQVWKNGRPLGTTASNSWALAAGPYAEYQVTAIDARGFSSFASEPLAVNADEKKYEINDPSGRPTREAAGFSGNGYAQITTDRNTTVEIPVQVEGDGLYALDFRYANGNGPTNTENKCALRTLEVDGRAVGTSLFPQRGRDEWSNWGFSNPVQVRLTKGPHSIRLVYRDWNENMNGQVNEALLDYLRVIRL